MSLNNSSIRLPESQDEYSSHWARDLTRALVSMQTRMGQPYSTGWAAPTNVTKTKTFDADSTTLAEIADVLGTLITDMKTCGVLGK